MKLTRRKAMGGIAIGAVVAGAGLGTGAFTQLEAERSVEIAIDDDAEALLTLEPNDGDPGEGASSIDGPGELKEYTGEAEEYLEQDGGTLGLDISDSGINVESTTTFKDLIRIENEASQALRVRVDAPEGLDFKAYGDEGTTSIVGDEFNDEVTVNDDAVAGITIEVDATEAGGDDLEGATVTIHAEAVAWADD